MIYRKEIDGLRALAVIPVILYHAGFNSFSGGYIGVDIFFVISGYLITYIIINELKNNTFSIANFYERRAKRILPALFLVMFSILPISFFIMTPYEIREFLDQILYTTFFTSNFLFFSEAGYFDGPSELKILLHTWSLAIEEQFYIFFPLFLAIAWKRNRKFITPLLIAVFVLSLISCYYLYYRNPNANFFLLPSRGWELLSGSFISIYLFNKYNSNVAPNFSYSNLLSGLGFFLIILSLIIIDSSTKFPGPITILPVLGTVLMILFTNQKTLLYKLLSNKLIVLFGLLSYSLYLWHQPILVIFRLAYGVHLDFNATMLALILSFIIAYISWKHFEVPLRHTKFSQKKVFRLVGLSMIFFSFVSLGFSYQIKKKNPGSLSGTLTELSSYVSKKQKDIETQEVNFPKNGKENLLIIGDSFSQDFINIIFESSLDNNFNYASVYIKYRCKNLNIEKNALINLIDPENREICERSSHYSDKKTQNLIRRADKIILASDWETEDLQFINQSIQNIKNLTSAEIIIVGSKIFLADGYGNYNLFRRNTYKMTKQELGDMRFSLPAEYIEMKNILSGFNFIDITEAYCEKDQCTFVDNNNYLLSYDGSHLTQEGAKFIAERINLKDLLSIQSD